MSLYGIMRTSTSGMAAQAGRLATVADNIANVNTNGYKRAFTEFSSLLISELRVVFRLHVRFGNDGYPPCDQ